MRKNILPFIVLLILAISSLAGCISGGDDNSPPTTTAVPTTSPATTPSATTSAPSSTSPPTSSPPPMVHNACSTGYINFDEGNGRHYSCNAPDDPVELWKSEILMTEGPVLADYGRAYLFQSNYGSYEVACYNVFTGEEYWTIGTPFMDIGDVLLKDGRIYMFQFGEDPILHCYDAADGSLLWSSVNIMELYPDETDIDLISLSYHDGKVVALLMTYSGLNFRDESVICCFDGSTGQLLWDLITEDEIHSYPAIENNVAYFTASLDDTVYDYSHNPAEALIGISLDNGDRVLNKMIQEYEYNQRDLIVSNGRIYAVATRRDIVGERVEYNMYLFCFSTSGGILWEKRLNEKAWGNLIMGNSKIFLSRDDQIICIDTDTHDVVWDMPIESNQFIGPVITNDKLIVFRSAIGTTPQVIAIDPSNGSEIWSLDLDGIQISNATSFYEDMLLVATDLGHLYCFG